MKTDYTFDAHPQRRRRPEDADVAMTPMIDVIFLLLVFFLATSSFRAVEKLLPSGVTEFAPVAGTASGEPPPDPPEEWIEQVVVRIGWEDGQVTVSVNGSRLGDFGELPGRFQRIREVHQDVPIVIDPDAEVPMQQVVRAYDWARQAGLLRVFLATRS